MLFCSGSGGFARLGADVGGISYRLLQFFLSRQKSSFAPSPDGRVAYQWPRGPPGATRQFCSVLWSTCFAAASFPGTPRTPSRCCAFWIDARFLAFDCPIRPRGRKRPSHKPSLVASARRFVDGILQLAMVKVKPRGIPLSKYRKQNGLTAPPAVPELDVHSDSLPGGWWEEKRVTANGRSYSVYKRNGMTLPSRKAVLEYVARLQPEHA